MKKRAMNQKHGFLEFALGMLVIGLVAFCLWIAYEKQNKYFHKTMLLKAEFDAVDGLMEGSPVKINGVSVGSVKSMQLNKENFLVIVTFSIQSNIRLPKDTMAAIVSESLFGSKVMSLAPGTEEGSFLAEGETIYKTQSSMNFEDLINKFIFNNSDSESKKKNEETPADNTDINFSFDLLNCLGEVGV